MLISIACGRGNPCQGPAGHLITAAAPSSLSTLAAFLPMFSPPALPSPALPHTPSPSSQSHREDVKLTILAMWLWWLSSWCVVAFLDAISLFMALLSALLAFLAIPWPAPPPSLSLAPSLSSSLSRYCISLWAWLSFWHRHSIDAPLSSLNRLMASSSFLPSQINPSLTHHSICPSFPLPSRLLPLLCSGLGSVRPIFMPG